MADVRIDNPRPREFPLPLDEDFSKAGEIILPVAFGFDGRLASRRVGRVDKAWDVGGIAACGGGEGRT